MKITRDKDYWLAQGAGPVVDIRVRASSLQEVRRLWFAEYVDQIRDNKDKLNTKRARRSVWV